MLQTLVRWLAGSLRQSSVSVVALLAIIFSAQLSAQQNSVPIDSIEAPEDAPEMGWTRGDAGTVFAGWDVFEAGPLPVTLDDITPDGYLRDDGTDPGIDSYGTTAEAIAVYEARSDICEPGEDASITGCVPPGLGVFRTSTFNWYSFSAAPDIRITLDTDAAHQAIAGPVRVVLQLANLGTDIDDSKVLLRVDHDNNAATPATELPFETKRVLYIGTAIDGDGNPQPNGLREYLYTWTLNAPLATYDIVYAAQGSSMSTNAAVVDVGPMTDIDVPLPLWSIFALFSLLLIATRTAKHSQRVR